MDGEKRTKKLVSRRMFQGSEVILFQGRRTVFSGLLPPAPFTLGADSDLHNTGFTHPLLSLQVNWAP